MNLADLLNHTLDFSILGMVFLGIWMFRKPASAKTGNLIAGVAMILAAFVVLYRQPPYHPYMMSTALIIGAVAGILLVARISMIQIPSMIAFQNGAGGLASFLISFAELLRSSGGISFSAVNETSGLLGLVMGAFTFSGSMVASGKLSGRLGKRPVHLNHHTFILGVNFLLIAVLIYFSLVGAIYSSSGLIIWTAIIISSILFGVLFSIRVGGADMPVLISFLNATTGLAAALCGMVLGNSLLISCGAAVAASGSILTHVMCRAMNRSLYRVFVPVSVVKPDEKPDRKSDTKSDTKIDMKPETESGMKPDTKTAEKTDNKINPMKKLAGIIHDSKRVVIVPGYGMAVAQAQFEVIALTDALISMGKDVKFAIHPVAGRMPGHMNVLLAEAGIDYDLLYEMDDINPDFANTDLALVVGACDVVNPSAIRVDGSPISGMPILNVHEAANIVCCNLDASPGYSGVSNPLYEDRKTMLLLGDARQTLSEIHGIILRES